MYDCENTFLMNQLNMSIDECLIENKKVIDAQEKSKEDGTALINEREKIVIKKCIKKKIFKYNETDVKNMYESIINKINI